MDLRNGQVSADKEERGQGISLSKKADGTMYAEEPEGGPTLRFLTGLRPPLDEFVGELSLSIKFRPQWLSKFDAKEAHRVFAFSLRTVASASLASWFFPSRDS